MVPPNTRYMLQTVVFRGYVSKTLGIILLGIICLDLVYMMSNVIFLISIVPCDLVTSSFFILIQTSGSQPRTIILRVSDSIFCVRFLVHL